MITEIKKKPPEPGSGSFDMYSETTTFAEADLLAERISQRAFEISKSRNMDSGPRIQDWLRAEREIRAEAGQPGKTQKQAFST